MRSTGEVMGIGSTFGEAFAKAQLSAGQALPERGFRIYKRQLTPDRRGVSRLPECLLNWDSQSSLRAARRHRCVPPA